LGLDLPEESSATELLILDVAGRRVLTLASGALNPGEHVVTWNGTDGADRRISPGVYFLRLETGDHVETKRMTMLR
jgi:flagellar hook assembly protein FlgD